MAYTITSGTGSNVAVGTNPTPAYPVSGLGSGKLAVLQLGVKNDAAGTLTPPGGWTQRGTTATVGADKQSIYTRELDGSETPGGTVTVTSTGTTGRRAAQIYIIDTAGGAGWNFEDIDTENSGVTPTTTISDNNVTTGGSNRLACNFIYYSARQSGGQEDFGGESGGIWAGSGFYDGGANPTLSFQTCELASAGTISGGVDTVINSSVWIIHGMSIWRNAASLPDLAVDDITWSGLVAVGKPVGFSANIANIGAAATPNTTHGVRFEVSGAAVAFSTSWQTSLVGTSGSATVAADGLWYPTQAGSANVVATVDYAGLITESNEGNNTRSEAITILNLSDLRVQDITYTPASPIVGDNVVFTAQVFNAGLGASPVTAHNVKFEVGGSQVSVSTTYTASIAVSATANVTADAAWTPGSVGTFSVVATVDPDNTIPETNDGNNNYSENITISIASAAAITKFAGRGPNASGEVWPLLGDYDSFFLTQGEGDDRYLQAVPAEYLTQTEGDARYLQTVPSEYVTQTEADAQGMPALQSVEYSGGSTPPGPVTHGTGNITLRTATNPSDYWQSRKNTGSSAVTVNVPAGYTLNGSNSIAANTAALFVKLASGAVFERWS